MDFTLTISDEDARRIVDDAKANQGNYGGMMGMPWSSDLSTTETVELTDERIMQQVVDIAVKQRLETLKQREVEAEVQAARTMIIQSKETGTISVISK